MNTTINTTPTSRLSQQIGAFAFAAVITVAMLAGIDTLADTTAPHAMLAQTSAPVMTAGV